MQKEDEVDADLRRGERLDYRQPQRQHDCDAYALNWGALMGHLCTTSESSRNDNPDIRRRRLLFRCWHRGAQESDLILGRFANVHLADFDSTQLERFEALLDCADTDLFDWIIAGSAAPKGYDHDVLCLLRAFAPHHGKKNDR
jgi:antitoxin CptB